MAFLSKVGSVLRQTVNAELSASRPSIYQAIRSMSSSKLFVGGISFNTDDSSLREAFGKYGEVVEARIIQDRETGRSRGFGFVTYTSTEDASSAIQALDGQDLHGRQIRVNYATDRARPAYGGGDYGSGGGGYGGGGAYGGSGGGYGGGGGYGSGGYGGNTGGGGYGGNTGGGGYGGGSYGSNTGGGGYGGGGNYGNDSYASGGGSYGGNVGSASGGFDGNSSTFGGFDESSGLGFGGNDSNSTNVAARDVNPGEPLDGNFRDDFDNTGDFAKRA